MFSGIEYFCSEEKFFSLQITVFLPFLSNEIILIWITFICSISLFFFVARDDQFGSDLLPEEVPVLLDQLPEEDRQNIEE